MLVDLKGGSSGSELAGPQEIPSGDSSALDHQQRAKCVQRVMESRTFAKSPRLLSFLEYVCRQTLSGAFDELSEQQVGINVFGRPSTYNPGEDNIVRTTARQLRQRLALYYQDEGKAEKIQIHMPRGGYAVTFTPVSRSEESTASASTELSFGGGQRESAIG